MRSQKRHGLRVDVLKLRVAIDVPAAFPYLAVRLQAITHCLQKLADKRVASLVPLPCKRPGEVTQAAARPQQGLHRIAPRRRFDQSLQIGHKRPILRRVALAPGAWLANPSGRSRDLVREVPKSPVDRGARQAADPRHRAHPAMSQRLCFQRNKAAAALFIQNRCHLTIASPCLANPRKSSRNSTTRDSPM